ncbi:hypothetical protein LZ32DRAFT_598124 [Colletotrichum eremochloae]|nr:hypothetical protein LZ32DRAFT_598124 [Colletotrichum eremochloae]
MVDLRLRALGFSVLVRGAAVGGLPAADGRGLTKMESGTSNGNDNPGDGGRRSVVEASGVTRTYERGEF